jgi:hypothetical protein
VSVRGANQNIAGRNIFHEGTGFISEQGGETQKIATHNGDAGGIASEHERANLEFAFFARNGVRRTNAAGNGQQRIGRYNSRGNTDPKFRVDER